MDTQQAQRIIRDTFESPFEKSKFIRFIKNLLNRMDESSFSYQGNYIPDAYKPTIRTLERIGKYTDGENTLDILVINLQKATSLERARTMQRNFIAWYLNGSRGGEMKDAALAAFVSPGKVDWRFSLVKMDYRFENIGTGRVKVKEEYTPARRWSFLVGANEKSHTAQSRLVDILTNDEQAPALKELEKAFDIEVVTKEFFLKYRALFLRTKEELDKIVQNDPKVRDDFKDNGVDTVNFAKKLLGQIVFLYFLQKKGWFGAGRDAAWGDGSRHFLRELFAKKHGGYANFFNDILEPLFYEALRTDRSYDDDYYSRFNCKIPFLNGGLFDPIGNYTWVHNDILLPDNLFSNDIKTPEGDLGDGILDVFDRYNFTVQEDEPLEKEVAIDPELLGKAYEKFNAIRPDNYDEFRETLKSGRTGEENKFNKKFGVYYTPREIVHYMCQQSLIYYLATELDGKASKEDIEIFITTGELVGENETRVVNAGKETGTYSHQLPESIRANAELVDQKLANITVCDPAVGSGAFPVGMMSEIVKARNTLTAFYPNGSRTPYEFKRRCIEHSLYGVDIDPGAVEIAKLRLWLSLVVDEEDIKRIKPLPNLDYKIVCGDSLLGYPYTPMGLEKIEQIKTIFLSEFHPTRKRELHKQITDTIEGIFKNTEKSLGYRVTMDFKINFSEVFHEKGGFDVVIGNPPYVRHEKIQAFKPALKTIYDCYDGIADLYVYFFERGYQVLRKNGVLTFITSNKYFRASYGKNLRWFLSDKNTILQIIDFGDAPVFNATSYPNIIILKKEKHTENYAQVLTWKPGPSISEFPNIFSKESFRLPQITLTSDNWQLEMPQDLNLYKKILLAGIPLAEYINGRFYYGIKTGLNEAYIIDRATRDALIEKHPSSAELIRPFLKGRDVKRWTVEFSEQYFIKIESSQNVTHPWSGKSNKDAEKIFAKIYPAIYAHMEQYREPLHNRTDQGNYYWELRACAYWHEFDFPKIIYPDIAKQSEFTFDNDGYYLINTLYLIPTKDFWLLGILNSNVVLWFYTRVSTKIRGDFVRFIAQYVSQIPIPVINKEQRNAIEKLVSRILSTKKNNPATNILDLEAEIDRLVYQLYGLTAGEIAIIEERGNR